MARRLICLFLNTRVSLLQRQLCLHNDQVFLVILHLTLGSIPPVQTMISRGISGCFSNGKVACLVNIKSQYFVLNFVLILFYQDFEVLSGHVL